MSADHYRVLLDFDALMDTRLATLASIDESLANEVGQTEEYYNRYSDKLSQINEQIDDKVFADRYLKRNKDILQYCLSTDVLQLITLGFNSMMPSIHRGIIPKDVRVVINFYPYRLSKTEMRLIEDMVLQHLPYEVSVESIYLDIYNLTPSNLALNYKEWYTYDIEGWVDLHQKVLLSRPITSVNVILPKLSTSGNDPLAESFDVDPFSARELLFKPYINLNYIDLKYFTYNHKFVEHLKKVGFLEE